MNSKLTRNLQLSTAEPKKQKPKLSKQLEQEQSHRNGDHMEGYQREVEGWEEGTEQRGIKGNGYYRQDK